MLFKSATFTQRAVNSVRIRHNLPSPRRFKTIQEAWSIYLYLFWTLVKGNYCFTLLTLSCWPLSELILYPALLHPGPSASCSLDYGDVFYLYACFLLSSLPDLPPAPAHLFSVPSSGPASLLLLMTVQPRFFSSLSSFISRLPSLFTVIAPSPSPAFCVIFFPCYPMHPFVF